MRFVWLFIYMMSSVIAATFLRYFGWITSLTQILVVFFGTVIILMLSNISEIHSKVKQSKT